MDRAPHDDPALYGELSGWFHLLTAPEDYAEEAAYVLGLLREGGRPPPRTLLELGSGGGNTASHLGGHLRLTLVDRSPGMLDLSRTINPRAEHLAGDMRDVRLGRTFDAVLLHDALMYLTTERDLRATCATAAAHLGPGGLALWMPDCVRETFRPGADHGGHDGPGRAMRYLEWTWDPDPSDTTYLVDFAFLLREGDGAPRVVHDRHVHGLFPRALWLDAIRGAGLDVEDRVDPWGRVVFLATRPPA